MKVFHYFIPLFNVPFIALAQSFAPANCTHPSQFFAQQVEHAASNGSRFQQQYQVIDDYFKLGGPILFYQGGETESMTCLEDLIIPTWAKELGALAVGIEHRFFGASRPNNDSDLPARFQSLTLDNVVLDFITLLDHIKQTVPGTNESKVIVSGGSYAGFLSALLRLNHPDTFFGSIAMGAPLRSLGYEWENTGKSRFMKTASNIYLDRSAAAAAKINQNFILCTVPKDTSELEGIFGAVVTAFVNNAMYSWAPGNPLAPGRKGNPLDCLVQATLAATSATEVLNASLAIYWEIRSCVDWAGPEFEVVPTDSDSWAFVQCSWLPVQVHDIPAGIILLETAQPANFSATTCEVPFNVSSPSQEQLESKYHFSADDLATATRIFFTGSQNDPTTSLEPMQFAVNVDVDRLELVMSKIFLCLFRARGSPSCKCRTWSCKC